MWREKVGEKSDREIVERVRAKMLSVERVKVNGGKWSS